jgi:hypothetical protein
MTMALRLDMLEFSGAHATPPRRAANFRGISGGVLPQTWGDAMNALLADP